MKEPIGYNDEQFNDLPDEDASWRKMEKLLDKDDRRRRIIPVWFRFPAMGMLLAIILAAGIFYFRGVKNETASTSENVPSKSMTEGDRQAPAINQVTPSNEPGKGQLNVQAGVVENGFQKKVVTTTIENRWPAMTTRPTGKRTVIKHPRRSLDVIKEPKKLKDTLLANVSDQPKISVADNVEKTEKEEPVRQKDGEAPSPVTDSVQKKPLADTLEARPAVASNKEKPKKAKPLSWSIGISLQQPLALGAQGSSAYNYQGKRNWAGDHLPGVYVSAGSKKWWGTASFHYGVPQPVQQVYFSQSTQYDPSSYTATTERYAVEKMYYHQLSLSANYALLPRISAGLGGSYQILAGAVTQRELQASNVITGASQTSRSLTPLKGFRDSFLYKTTAATFIQTEYQWNRLSLGLRYSYSLQPFIRYTQPDGQVMEAKNNSLQMVVRFRVWK